MVTHPVSDHETVDFKGCMDSCNLTEIQSCGNGLIRVRVIEELLVKLTEALVMLCGCNSGNMSLLTIYNQDFQTTLHY